MTKYMITTNCGYGDCQQVEECKDLDEAENLAYEIWKEEAESQATYTAEELTPELAEDYGFEDELKD